MASPPLTVQLPDLLYDNLRARAEQAKRTVQEELVHVVSLVVPGQPKLPPALQHELDSLSGQSAEILWELAQSRVAEQHIDRLDALSGDRQLRSLTPAEQDELLKLLQECDRVMLVRAQAALLLKQRGHDISSLFQSP